MKLQLDFTVQGLNADTNIAVVPHVHPDGKPAVLVVLMDEAEGVYPATVNGKPAHAIFLSDDGKGTQNGPWELGHLLAEKWKEAEALALARLPKTEQP